MASHFHMAKAEPLPYKNEYKIELKCKHSICFNCYLKIHKCPF